MSTIGILLTFVVVVVFIIDKLFFSDLTYLVLDEADTLFDNTFRPLTMELLERINVSTAVVNVSTAVVKCLRFQFDKQRLIIYSSFSFYGITVSVTDLGTCTHSYRQKDSWANR